MTRAEHYPFERIYLIKLFYQSDGFMHMWNSMKHKVMMTVSLQRLCVWIHRATELEARFSQICLVTELVP